MKTIIHYRQQNQTTKDHEKRKELTREILKLIMCGIFPGRGMCWWIVSKRRVPVKFYFKYFIRGKSSWEKFIQLMQTFLNQMLSPAPTIKNKHNYISKTLYSTGLNFISRLPFP